MEIIWLGNSYSSNKYVEGDAWSGIYIDREKKTSIRQYHLTHKRNEHHPCKKNDPPRVKFEIDVKENEKPTFLVKGFKASIEERSLITQNHYEYADYVLPSTEPTVFFKSEEEDIQLIARSRIDPPLRLFHAGFSHQFFGEQDPLLIVRHKSTDILLYDYLELPHPDKDFGSVYIHLMYAGDLNGDKISDFVIQNGGYYTSNSSYTLFLSNKTPEGLEYIPSKKYQLEKLEPCQY